MNPLQNEAEVCGEITGFRFVAHCLMSVAYGPRTRQFTVLNREEGNSNGNVIQILTYSIHVLWSQSAMTAVNDFKALVWPSETLYYIFVLLEEIRPVSFSPGSFPL